MAPGFVLRILSILFLPLLTGTGGDRTMVERNDLNRFFVESGYDGSFLLYDLKGDSFVSVNAAATGQRFIPASTFKIFNSLVALETGVIADERTVIPWDGKTRDREILNRDHDLGSAIRYSVVPYYQELARRIGRERLQRYVDSVGYGNGDISGPIGLFWLDGPLMISPMEQIEFLVRLYRNDLPFSMRTMEIVRRILPMEASDEFVLKAKTGWAQRGNTHVGWWVGWVERRDRAYFFATVLHTDRPGENFGQVRLALTRQILKELKILP